MKRTTLHLLILLMVGWMGYAGYQIVRKWKNFSNEVVLGIHWKEVQWLCSRWNYPIKDFLQRAQPYGVSVIFGEDITLQDLVDQGTLLYFSGAESEKWKAFGLIDPEAPIRPRQLWVRETWLVARILQAARSQDIFLYTTTASNYTILEIPFSLNLKTLHVGIDETNVEWLKSLGFQVRDSWAAGREAMFSADGQEVRGGMGIVGSRVGEKWSAKFVQNISVLSSIQEVGQAMLQNPGRWLNLRLEIHRPIDENVEGIRRVSRHLLRLGFNATSPQETAWIPQISFKAEMHLRRVGALLLGCLAPLLGLRLAFRSLRWSFRNPRWPLASPAWEVLVAYGASIGVVCFFS
ncbi:MAG: hypothetical protein HY399_04930, partial [Elusimicrobia bacterium]|nr:hypothetical protein [Elusimicrobiota bacterium]